MDKIKFINCDTIFNATVSPNGTNVLKVTFTGVMPAVNTVITGFDILLDAESKKVIGKYEGYTTLYRDMSKDESAYYLSNDGSVYVPPVTPTPVVPTPPTPEEILAQTKAEKLNEISSAYATQLGTVRNITMSDGKTVDTFNYADSKALSDLREAFNTATTTKLAVPYYNSENVCKIYSVADIAIIYIDMLTVTTQLLTLEHQLLNQVDALTNTTDIKAITFATSSLDKEHLAQYTTIMTQAQTIVDSIKKMLQG